MSGHDGSSGGRDISPQQKAEQMASVIAVLEGQLEDVIRNEESALRARSVAVSASESVRQIKDGGNGAESADILVGIGGGVFVPTKVSTSDRLLLEIGSGTAVEKEPAYVLNYLESRIRNIDIVIKNTGAERARLAERIAQYRMQLNQTIQSVYGQGQSGHV